MFSAVDGKLGARGICGRLEWPRTARRLRSSRGCARGAPLPRWRASHSAPRGLHLWSHKLRAPTACCRCADQRGRLGRRLAAARRRSGGPCGLRAAALQWRRSAGAGHGHGRVPTSDCSKPEPRRVCSGLIDAGAAVDQQIPGAGDTALFLASQQGNAGVVRHLISAGASVGLPIDDGGTPLFVASMLGRTECVRLLLEAQAAPSTVVQPRCALPASKGTARACGSCSTPTRMSKAAVRATAALPASQEGHHECVEMLIGAGAAVDIASSDGTSALFMTCQPGHTRSAELLLEGGASASLAGHEDGSTPLHAASEGGHLPCVLLLLAAGANPLQPMRGPGRLTPLAFAARYGHPRCVLALREAATQSCARAAAAYMAATNSRRAQSRLGLGPLVRHWHTGSM